MTPDRWQEINEMFHAALAIDSQKPRRIWQRRANRPAKVQAEDLVTGHGLRWNG